MKADDAAAEAAAEAERLRLEAEAVEADRLADRLQIEAEEAQARLRLKEAAKLRKVEIKADNAKFDVRWCLADGAVGGAG